MHPQLFLNLLCGPQENLLKIASFNGDFTCFGEHVTLHTYIKETKSKIDDDDDEKLETLCIYGNMTIIMLNTDLINGHSASNTVLHLWTIQNISQHNACALQWIMCFRRFTPQKFR